MHTRRPGREVFYGKENSCGECRITVIDKKCFTDFQEKYLADPKSGPCPFFNVGDEFILKRTPQQDDFYHLMEGKFCGEASFFGYRGRRVTTFECRKYDSRVILDWAKGTYKVIVD